jgi:hypothetical protein
MQAKKFFNPDSIKRTSIFLDILIPFLLFYSLIYHNLFLSWFFLVVVITFRILLVMVSQ